MDEPRCKHCKGRIYRKNDWSGWRHLDTGMYVCVPRPPGAVGHTLAELNDGSGS